MSTVYTLPTVTTKLGTFTVSVTSTVDGLTTPAQNTIVSLPKHHERLDLIPGTFDIPTATLSFVDDYTVHADGFWALVLAGDTDIQVLLDEGSGNTFAFRGIVISGENVFEEKYVGAVKRRVGTVTLKSYLTKLQDITVAQVLYELISICVPDDPVTGFFNNIIDIFNVAIALAYSQAYAVDDAYVQYGTTRDLIFFYGGTGAGGADELSFQIKDGSLVFGYSDPADVAYWGTAFPSAWDLIKAVCVTFGWIPRYEYDLATSRHKIQLLQRGRSGISAFDPGAGVTSTYRPSALVSLKKCACSIRGDGSKGWYFNDGIRNSGSLPEWFNADLSVPMLWAFAASVSTLFERLVFMDPSSVIHEIDNVTIWRYDLNTTQNYSTGVHISQKALMDYYVGRYYGTGQKTYTRVYPTFQYNGNSHTSACLQASVTIDAEGFDVVEFDKDYTTGELNLTLVKV
jgi:hypothetical protein